MCQYGEGFDYNIAYNLPITERKLQLMILKKRLEEDASKQESNSSQLNENTSMSQIKSLTQKFNKGKTHEFNIPKT